MASPDLKISKGNISLSHIPGRNGRHYQKNKGFVFKGEKESDEVVFDKSFQLFSGFILRTSPLSGKLLLVPSGQGVETLPGAESSSSSGQGKKNQPSLFDSERTEPLQKFVEAWKKSYCIKRKLSSETYEVVPPGGEQREFQYNQKAAEEIYRSLQDTSSPQFYYICGGRDSGKTDFLEAIKYYILEKYPQKKILFSKGKKLIETLLYALKRFPRHQIYQYFIDNSDIILIDDLVEHSKGISAKALRELSQLLISLQEHRKKIYVTSHFLPSQLLEKNRALGKVLQTAKLIYLRTNPIYWQSRIIDSSGRTDISELFSLNPLPQVYTRREAVQLIYSTAALELLSPLLERGSSPLEDKTESADKLYRKIFEYTAYLSKEILSLSYQKLSELLGNKWSPTQVRYAYLKIKNSVVEDPHRYNQLDRLERKLRSHLHHLAKVNASQELPTLFTDELEQKKQAKRKSSKNKSSSNSKKKRARAKKKTSKRSSTNSNNRTGTRDNPRK